MFAISPKNPLIKKLTSIAEEMGMDKIYDDFLLKEDSAFRQSQEQIKPRLFEFMERAQSAVDNRPNLGEKKN